MLQRPRIDHIVFGHPGAARRQHAPSRVVERLDVVGVGVDHELDAAVARQARVAVAEIEAVRLRIDLERHAVGLGGIDHLLDVDLGAFAAQQHAAR